MIQDVDRVLKFESITSTQIMAGAIQVCPGCSHRPVPVVTLRAGFNSFVAAVLCPACRSLFRGNVPFGYTTDDELEEAFFDVDDDPDEEPKPLRDIEEVPF